MQIDDLILLYNKSKSYCDKHDEIIKYIFTEVYTYLVNNYLMAKEEIGDFIEYIQPRFEHIISSYVKPIIPFKAYLDLIIKRELKFYSIKKTEKSFYDKYLSILPIDNIDENKGSYIDYLVFTTQNDIDINKSRFKSKPIKTINTEEILPIAIICSPQLSGHEINNLNKYFTDNGINNFTELCAEASNYYYKRTTTSKNNAELVNKAYAKLIKLELELKNKISIKEDTKDLQLKIKRKKITIENYSKKINSFKNRITYREISKILDINRGVLSSQISNVKQKLELYEYNKLE